MTGYCKVTGSIHSIDKNAINLDVERIMARKHAWITGRSSSRGAMTRYARLISCRRLTLCLQVLAIALLMTAVLRSALVSPDFHGDGRSQTSAATGENCAAMVGNSVPARPNETHSECCVICNGAAREPLAIFMAAACLAAFGPARKPSSLAVYFFASTSASSVPGSASSWLSRAPPALP